MTVRKHSPVRVIVAVFTVAIISIGFWFRQVPWRADFSKWPPVGVFQMVMGQRPPPGVSGIQVAGRHYFIKRWVWMRFQATRPAMTRLAVLGEPLSGAETQRLLREKWTANNRYDEVDLQRIRWDDVSRLVHPVAYEFYTGSPSTWQWHGIMLFDYPGRTVYVRAIGD